MWERGGGPRALGAEKKWGCETPPGGATPPADGGGKRFVLAEWQLALPLALAFAVLEEVVQRRTQRVVLMRRIGEQVPDQGVQGYRGRG